MSGKESSPAVDLLEFTNKPLTMKQTAELLDVHQQLRHEANGLRLQLASKQEILERWVTLHDQLSEELHTARITILRQQDVITDLANQMTNAKLQLAALQAQLLQASNNRNPGEASSLSEDSSGEETSSEYSSESSSQSAEDAAEPALPDVEQLNVAKPALAEEQHQPIETEISNTSTSLKALAEAEAAQPREPKPLDRFPPSPGEDLNDQVVVTTTRQIMQLWQQHDAAALAGPAPPTIHRTGVRFKPPVPSMDFQGQIPGVPLPPMLSPGCKITGGAKGPRRGSTSSS